MPRKPYLHEQDGFPDLIEALATEIDVHSSSVEKDYWIMHCLHGLTAAGFEFQLKGGTSLSKGFGIITRFSEDIDIRINPKCADFTVYTGKNHTKRKHRESKLRFFDWLAENIRIDGIVRVERDHDFDDVNHRTGGIRLHYDVLFDGSSKGIKDGILLEANFSETAPNMPRTISSWALDRAMRARESNAALFDNRAVDIACYHPGHTFVEKLQAISSKFRRHQDSGVLPQNFLRHYYDICQLLDHPDVQSFIGTPQYHDLKERHFRLGDNLNIAKNEAFLLSNPETRSYYAREFQTVAALCYGERPSFENVLAKIQGAINTL